MDQLPDCIHRYWHQWLADQLTSGYALTDSQGTVMSWGGALQQLGIGPLEAGRDLSDQLLFMEGLLPMTEPSLYLPMVTTDSQQILDIHILRQEDGYALLFLDACHRAHCWAETQQAANASAIPILPETLENFIHACDMAALQLDSNDRLKLMGQAPDWLRAIYPDLVSGSRELQTDNCFSFLENFQDIS